MTEQEAIDCQGNIKLTLSKFKVLSDEWHGKQYGSYYWRYPDSGYTIGQKKLVLIKDDRVVLYHSCEACGAKWFFGKKSNFLDENNCCVHCGNPVFI